MKEIINLKFDSYLQLYIPGTKYKVGIWSERQSFLEVLYKIFTPYIYKKTGSYVDEIGIYVDFNSEHIIFTTNIAQKKIEIEEGNEIGQVCRILQWIQRSVAPWNLYHGAAMNIEGKTVAFLGYSGTGKTTLVAYLIKKHRESLCLAEDILIINCEKNMLCPYPRSLLLREGSKKLLQEEYHYSIDQMTQIKYGNQLANSVSFFEISYSNLDSFAMELHNIIRIT